MTTLTRCPLCGADSGYTLHEGSSSKWWAIHCPACGEQVSECRSGYVDPPEGRASDADEAWNEAGKYAQGLFDEAERLRGLLRDLLNQADVCDGTAQMDTSDARAAPEGA